MQTKLSFLFSVLLVALVFSVSYGQKYKEGRVVYKITISNLPEEMKQMESMMPQESIMWFKGNKSCTEMKSAMYSVRSINDLKAKTQTTMMDMMGQKIYTVATDEQAKKAMDLPKYKLKKTNETKDILNLKCKKAIVEIEADGEPRTFIIYYTDEIKAGNNMFPEIEGAMMEYQISQGPMDMKFTMKEFSQDKVDASVFDIPADYKQMTPEEVAKMMGK